MATENWFKWGWYFTLTQESGVQYPSTDLHWNVVESDFLLPNERLYGGGVGIIQFTSENFELLRRIITNGYDMTDFPEGTIKSDLMTGEKTIDWFKHSNSPEGGLFNVNETYAIKDMLESEEGLEAQAFYNEKYFFENNASSMDAIQNSNLDEKVQAFLVNIIVLRPASVSDIISQNPSNLDEAVSITLSIPALSDYGNRMNGIANGLEGIEIGDNPPVDFDSLLSGEVDPEPEPEKPDIDFSPITDFFDGFTEELAQAFSKLLSTRLYQYDTNKKNMGNHFLHLTKEMDNTYKLKPTINFTDLFNGVIDTGKETIGDIIDTINPGDNTSEIYFPVNPNGDGINFWYPPYESDLTANMDYGQRTSGAFHAGYDIGGGGITGHGVYATTAGTVKEVREGSGWGWLIVIEHSTDDYSSLYGHLVMNSNLVNVGDKVKAGEQIAVMGNTGGDYAIHLHYELSPTGEFRPDPQNNTIDPKEYLKVTGNNKTGLKSPI